MESLGYAVGDQGPAELLIENWAQRDFRALIEYCETADAFQDIPFSLDYTYVALDQAFPGSRYILTVRRSGEEWYESLVRFHAKIVGKDRTPTVADLQAHPYRHDGWMWRTQQLIYGADESTLYDRELYVAHYERHVEQALDYFRYRPDDLLVLNVSDAGAMDALCAFLDVAPHGQPMPHLNASR